jgi:hypothetical protein
MDGSVAIVDYEVRRFGLEKAVPTFGDRLATQLHRMLPISRSDAHRRKPIDAAVDKTSETATMTAAHNTCRWA